MREPGANFMRKVYSTVSPIRMLLGLTQDFNSCACEKAHNKTAAMVESNFNYLRLKSSTRGKMKLSSVRMTALSMPDF